VKLKNKMILVVLLRNVLPLTLSSISVEEILVVGIFHPLAPSDMLHLVRHPITHPPVRVQTLLHGTAGAHVPLWILAPLELAHHLFW
jgi:hypothetical protein